MWPLLHTGPQTVRRLLVDLAMRRDAYRVSQAERFQMVQDALRDALGCFRIHWDAFRCFWMLLDTLGRFLCPNSKPCESQEIAGRRRISGHCSERTCRCSKLMHLMHLMYPHIIVEWRSKGIMPGVPVECWFHSPFRRATEANSPKW